MGQAVGLNISVGRSCFVRCSGCYNHFGRSAQPLDTPNLLRFLGVAAKASADRVTFCGGDPLSRPDILPLLEATAELGYTVALDTVGTPLLGDTRTLFYGRTPVSRVDADRLATLVDRIGIPVDGASNEIVQTFRAGRDELLDEQVQILEILDGAGANVCVNTVAHRENIEDLEAILRVIAVHPSVRTWQVFQFSATGPHGYRSRTRFSVDDDSFALAMGSLRAALARSGAAVELETKSNRDRRGRYLLVDSDGLAWIPIGGHDEPSAERVVLGDIANPDDDGRLLSILFADDAAIHAAATPSAAADGS